jgi:hypothetical protein
MADIDLPVWTVRPNWRSGVRERLEWLTDVLPGSTGNEQRRAVRLSPRRIFDFDINPMLNDRSFVDLWIHKVGEEKFMFPLWHDKAKLSSVAAAASSRLNFDNTFREFEVGGLAVVYKSTFEFEVVEIEESDDLGLDLVTPLASTWGAGTVVHPLRRAYLDTEVSSSQLTKRVGDLQLTAILDTPNDYATGAEVLPLFTNYPVVTLEPNRRDDLRMTYTRTMAEIDSRLGKLYRKDTASRAFTTNFYNWQAKGRENHHKLRQSLYRLNGRQKAVWMPTFGRDAVIATTGTIGQTFIQIEKIGYGYLGTQNIGRDHLLLKVGNNVQVVKINSTGVATNPAYERLNLASPLTFGLPIGTELSFIDTMRLDQDDLEIMHHTDTDGICEVSGAFKSFTNKRNSAGVIEHPIPVTAMSPGSCGEPEAVNPCLPALFEGWYLMFRTLIYAPSPPLASNSRGSTIWDVSSGGGMNVGTPCRAYGSGTTSRCDYADSTGTWREWRYDYDILAAISGATIRYEHQYSFKVHETNARLKLQYRRWNDTGWTTIFNPTGDGVDGTTAVDGSVDLDDLFPRNNYWIVPDLTL